MCRAVIKTWITASAGEKIEPGHTAGGNVKWSSHFGKQSDIELPYSTSEYMPKRNKDACPLIHNVHISNLCTNVHSSNKRKLIMAPTNIQLLDSRGET